jgi:hypothetical protein
MAGRLFLDEGRRALPRRHADQKLAARPLQGARVPGPVWGETARCACGRESPLHRRDRTGTIQEARLREGSSAFRTSSTKLETRRPAPVRAGTPRAALGHPDPALVAFFHHSRFSRKCWEGRDRRDAGNDGGGCSTQVNRVAREHPASPERDRARRVVLFVDRPVLQPRHATFNLPAAGFEAAPSERMRKFPAGGARAAPPTRCSGATSLDGLAGPEGVIEGDGRGGQDPPGCTRTNPAQQD